MVDYYITPNFDIQLNEWDDIKEVRGREEFEQALVIHAHNELQEIIGSSRSSNSLTERIKLVINRLAERFGIIEGIEAIRVSRDSSEQSTVNVSVYYVTGDIFEDTI